MLASSRRMFMMRYCDLRPVGKSTYQKYEKAIDAWVTEDCHVGLVFNVMLCHCVKDGVVVTGLPVTSTKSYTGITNSNITTTTKSLPTTTKSVTTTIRLPTTTLTTKRLAKTTSMTTTTESSDTTTVIPKPTTTETACPLVPSSSGPEYFRIFLGTFGAIELTCPSKQIFDPLKCRCFI
ncbi:unnamed protein product [Mytilus edulis]|uniref:Uncharacterized protein n=1 Tax=Mytilus edulis TaxID=6550 RepID=A0A8S3RQ60_MYTED|nr:unnamed protein product [Mytilus edulis]